MKKVLLALFLAYVAFVTVGITSFAAGTGNLVVHFQAWEEESYDSLGSWAWGDTASGKLKDGLDDFGAYWEYNDVAVGTEVGFIAVTWLGTEGPDWNAKLTDDIIIPSDTIIEGETVHVYVFEGKQGNGNAPVYVADPSTFNLMLVYYDPAGAYEETLGVHNWGWTNDAEAWATPNQIFSAAGYSEAGIEVKGAMLHAVEDYAGLLIYAGDDASKHTGDLNDTNVITDKTPGAVNFAYVVNGGAGLTDNSNVFTTASEFADVAFTFKLLAFNLDEMSGTYAVDPKTIVVRTSSSVESPYPLAENKEEAEEIIKGWFKVRENLGDGNFGDPLLIERVDFAKSNTTLNSFVVILEEGLDNTKNYEVFFDTMHPEDLAEAKEVEVTINVQLPSNTPSDATISLGASFGGWNPAEPTMQATKISDTEYTITFKVSVQSAYTTFEYKWTQGSWDIGENLSSGNRVFVLENTKDSIVYEDVVSAWDNDSDAADTKYPATNRSPFIPTDAEASLAVNMDTDAPVLTFISPLSFLGADDENRVIEIPWGQPFDFNLFPRYAVSDDRDGDLTSFVFVPKGDFSVLDTSTEGDYTIMLEVHDNWGNVTQVTFIFRVVKPQEGGQS